MAPNNFEKQLKEKFLDRSITPSHNAWNKLETQLVSKKSRKNNLNIYWLVAAVFIGVVVVLNVNKTSIFTGDKVTPDVVKKEAVKTHKILKEKKSVIEQNNEKQTEKILVYKEEQERVNKLPETETAIVSNAKEIVAIENTIEITKIDDGAIANVDENNDEFVTSKVEEVLLSISELNEKNGSITDAEIDALLLKAQREISARRILKNNKVDATALLLDVEEELDKSFRDKIFKAIKGGYLKVKTAVAERNH